MDFHPLLFAFAPALFVLMPKIPVPAREVGDWVERALALIGMTRKEACARMGISEFEFSRQLNHRGVNFARLRLLGPEFMVALFETAGIKPKALKVLEERLEQVERKVGGVA
jgi:hypothetical protein